MPSFFVTIMCRELLTYLHKLIRTYISQLDLVMDID
uniref:Uncharacterized protein n=1 Tax=Arundo donax TaxID=35708 RepID=A0A0A8XPP3_ARUDO